MNGDGLCVAWEVLMLRPIEGLLLLQLRRDDKVQSFWPPTLSHLLRALDVLLSLCVLLCLCALLLLFSLFVNFPTIPPHHLSSRCVSLFLCLFPSACLHMALANSPLLTLPHSPLVSRLCLRVFTAIYDRFFFLSGCRGWADFQWCF